MPLHQYINDPVAHEIIHNGVTFQVCKTCPFGVSQFLLLRYYLCLYYLLSIVSCNAIALLPYSNPFDFPTKYANISCCGRKLAVQSIQSSFLKSDTRAWTSLLSNV